MEKKVSIIMGIYNCEDTLSETIESILSQSYKNWELIMCDDGSQDNTKKIAESYSEKESRIKVLANDRNLGLAKTLNKCIEESTGTYLMRHDGDDIMLKGRIEKQVNFMDFNEVDICGAGAYLFDNEGVWGIRHLLKKPNKNSMILGTPFIHATVIMKKEKIVALGGYSENYITRQRLEDYDLWIKCFENNLRLENIFEPLISIREDKAAFDRKKRKFRLTETKARLEACKRLNISYYKRILALKPLILIFFPKKMLKTIQLKKSDMQVEKMNLK